MTITESWRSIDAWLARHAPATYAVLAPPATGAELAAMDLPPEVVESLRCHNGLTEWANVLPEGPPSSAAEIAANYRIRLDLAEDFVYPPDQEPYWHPAWIPWSDSDGDLQFVDLRPGPTHGQLALAPHDGPVDFIDAFASLTGYLQAVVHSLDHGTGINNWYPYLTTHHELWWDQGPDKRSVNDEPLARAPTLR